MNNKCSRFSHTKCTIDDLSMLFSNFVNTEYMSNADNNTNINIDNNDELTEQCNVPIFFTPSICGWHSALDESRQQSNKLGCNIVRHHQN